MKNYPAILRTIGHKAAHEAADEIERLEAENARLREALEHCRRELDCQQAAHLPYTSRVMLYGIVCKALNEIGGGQPERRTESDSGATRRAPNKTEPPCDLCGGSGIIASGMIQDVPCPKCTTKEGGDYLGGSLHTSNKTKPPLAAASPPLVPFAWNAAWKSYETHFPHGHQTALEMAIVTYGDALLAGPEALSAGAAAGEGPPAGNEPTMAASQPAASTEGAEQHETLETLKQVMPTEFYATHEDLAKVAEVCGYLINHSFHMDTTSKEVCRIKLKPFLTTPETSDDKAD